MRRRPAILLLVSSLFLMGSLAWGQGSYKAVTGGAPNVSGIPASVQQVLEANSVQFENGQGTALCQIWWRKGIPTTKSSSSADVLYGGLGMGEFLGVVHFPKATTDYRGQSIKPGDYTLRYALIPQDGNHMGVSSYRDFLLLIPVADDANPSQLMTFDQVVKASRLTAGTGHPAVMMLDPAGQGASKFPAAFQDDQGNWALGVKLDVSQSGQPQQMPFALVLVGQYQG